MTQVSVHSKSRTIYINILLKIMPIFTLIKRLYNFSKIRTFCLSSGLGNKNNSWPILRRRYVIFIKSKTKTIKIATKSEFNDVSISHGSSSFLKQNMLLSRQELASK